MPRFAGMIHASRRRSPFTGGGGSSFPAAVATKVFSVIGADEGASGSDDIVMGGSVRVDSAPQRAWQNHMTFGFGKSSVIRFTCLMAQSRTERRGSYAKG